ncbi:MAG: hypothetical protein JHC95_15325 [Solirubrobacteraceae bacterium]|nr:hypothetical protein [Solirubrobacteraceae bacterium]
MRSLPSLPLMRSTAFVPRSRSLPGPPSIVAANATLGTSARAAMAAVVVRRCFTGLLLIPVAVRAFPCGGPGARPSHRALTLREKSVRRRLRGLGHPGRCVMLRAMSRRVIALLLVLVVLPAGPALAEAMRGTKGDDTIDGTARADRIDGLRGNDQLHGRGGNDRVNGGAGNDLLSGDAGNDRLNGGPGDDTLLGGAGGDILNGGPGADTIIGGNGRDVIRARDGVADRITCGAKRDRVTADAIDDVARDCESVSRG